MLVVLFGLLLLNAMSLLRLKLPKSIGNTELFLSLLIDVATLTILLYLSGGATNLRVSLSLQVILGAVLLKVWSTWVILITTTFALPGWPGRASTAAAAGSSRVCSPVYRGDDHLLCAQRGAAGDLYQPHHP